MKALLAAILATSLVALPAVGEVAPFDGEPQVQPEGKQILLAGLQETLEELKRKAQSAAEALRDAASSAWDKVQSWLSKGIDWLAKKVVGSELIQQIYKYVRGRYYITYQDQTGREQGVELTPLTRLARAPSQALRTLAAKFPVPSALANWTSRLKSLRAQVDLRGGMSSIRNQWWRGTCVAHAAIAALEYALGRSPGNLSEQYAYWLLKRSETGQDRCDSGFPTADSAGVLHANPVPQESDWSYQWLDPREPFRNDCFEHETWGTPPAQATRNARYYIKSFVLIDNAGESGQSIRNPAYLMSVLEAGYPIVIGMTVAGTDWKAWRAWYTPMIDVQVDKDRKPLRSDSGHAVVLVGYDVDKKAFLIRNSWGIWWGQFGYHWLSFDYVRTYAHGGYYVTAGDRR